MARKTNNVAFTALINPPGATPVLTRAQLWAGHLLKIRSAETFIPNTIQSTTILSESVDADDNPVTEREVVFRADGRRVKEVVTSFEDCRVEFVQGDGSKVFNIISESEGGLQMTFVFEWRHEGATEDEARELMVKERGVARMAVEGTIAATRELVVKGVL